MVLAKMISQEGGGGGLEGGNKRVESCEDFRTSRWVE